MRTKRKPRTNVASLRDIPNVGPATERDLHRLGIRTPAGLIGRDGIVLYRRLCQITGVRYDPCCADVFIAVVDYMNGAPAAPWFRYTARRKALMPPPAPAKKRPSSRPKARPTRPTAARASHPRATSS
ncbi:hypothetical protein PHYC_00796 [Phycisphaerales bacterium]|nr:hypothetical protein PHYC_00796 [Phycisphaerales bacterium]